MKYSANDVVRDRLLFAPMTKEQLFKLFDHFKSLNKIRGTLDYHKYSEKHFYRFYSGGFGFDHSEQFYYTIATNKPTKTIRFEEFDFEDELPEKWCIVRNRSNQKEVNDFFNLMFDPYYNQPHKKSLYSGDGQYYLNAFSDYMHYPKINNQAVVKDHVVDGYTEINYDTFLKIKKKKIKEMEEQQGFYVSLNNYSKFISSCDFELRTELFRFIRSNTITKQDGIYIFLSLDEIENEIYPSLDDIFKEKFLKIVPNFIPKPNELQWVYDLLKKEVVIQKFDKDINIWCNISGKDEVESGFEYRSIPIIKKEEILNLLGKRVKRFNSNSIHRLVIAVDLETQEILLGGRDYKIQIDDFYDKYELC